MEHNSKIKLQSVAKKVALVIMPLLFSGLLTLITIIFLHQPYVKPYIDMSMLIFSKEGNTIDEDISSIYNPESRPPENSDITTLPPDTSGVEENIISGKDIEFPGYETHYGELYFDNIDYTVNLFYGDSKRVLRLGAGQYIGSYPPGFGKPMLIAGHNTTYFSRLQELDVGDIITIRTNYGTFKYKIRETKVALHTDKDAYELDKEEEELILYTCYPFNAFGLTPQRYFVFADKIEGPVVQWKSE